MDKQNQQANELLQEHAEQQQHRAGNSLRTASQDDLSAQTDNGVTQTTPGNNTPHPDTSQHISADVRADVDAPQQRSDLTHTKVADKEMPDLHYLQDAVHQEDGAEPEHSAKTSNASQDELPAANDFTQDSQAADTDDEAPHEDASQQKADSQCSVDMFAKDDDEMQCLDSGLCTHCLLYTSDAADE